MCYPVKIRGLLGTTLRCHEFEPQNERPRSLQLIESLKRTYRFVG